ncbi:NAD(P)-binding protein [Periconia macrospinosa]|uniref:NAD(P)-binding protein n=1 Tax=Periconia macrospinosa TaxID=97972 RepID=A0A2V1E7Y0_9PLEO|nr:NAD(P)-binding protein [Periconia macrospinosa]
MATNTFLPPIMKAWTFSQPGTHRQVLSQTTVPTPNLPTGDEVLIKIEYAGLSFGDLKTMGLIPSFLRTKNSVPGTDYAGVIIAKGPLAPSKFEIGTEVFGTLETDSKRHGTGALCEYICLSTSSNNIVAPVPSNMTLQEAGAVAIGGLMAMLICKNGGIKEDCGIRMLVHGSSGQCGTAFIQVAKAMGAKEIVATCSTPNFDMVKRLGADVTIDYRKEAPFSEYLAKEYGDRKFDIIVDTVGAQDVYTHSPAFLKDDCVYVNIGDYTNGLFRTVFHWFVNLYWPQWLGGTPRRFIMFGPWETPKVIDPLTKLMADGKIKPVIERTVAFDQVLEGYDVVATKRTRGKVMVKVASS